MRDMKQPLVPRLRKLSALVLIIAPSLIAEPIPAARAAFDSYIKVVEARLAQQHLSPTTFLVKESDARLTHGEFLIERIPTQPLSGAILHHWRGTAFVAGATATDFDHLLRDFNAYPRHFAPQVIQASILSQAGDRMQAKMRVRQQHILTVVMDTTYDIVFSLLDPQHRYSISRSTRIAEIAFPGTPSEHALGADQEHGFLWRINTYWSYEERNGGLYLQIESVSLSRSIPAGLGWAVRPFVESVPRESMDFTLRSATKALHN
jgi:hypothetical protein